MAIAFVAGVEASVPNPADASLTTSAIDTTGANLIIFAVAALDTTFTLSDSKSNTYTALTAYGSGPVSSLYYCLNPTVGSGHTFTFTNATKYEAISVAAFSGVVTSSAFDVQNGNSSGSSGTTFATGSVTPSEDNELLFYCVANRDAVSASSVDVGSLLHTMVGVAATSYGLSTAYQIQTTATTRNPTFTLSGSSTFANASIATFKAAAGGAAFIPQKPFQVRQAVNRAGTY